MTRRMYWLVPLFIVVAGLMLLSLYVTDWRRDLSTNHAATSETDPDPRLHPIRTSLPPDEAVRAVEQAVAALPRWEAAGQKQEQGVYILSFVRATPILKFRDDITVRISADGGGSRIEAESRSRVGKGDLGQNPRNLRELLEPLRAELPAAGEAAP